MILEELRALADWSARHRKLAARLAIVLIATLVIDVVGTILVFLLERHVRGGDIHNLFDAFFFTTVQLLTVSSQIRNPLTTGGRVVDIALEIWAVVVVAGSAGAVASFFQAPADDKQ
ncbi:MAG TPA: hypothetical protein VGC78_01635 [Gaiellaceae bacterium]|jgi:hypothetical protein